MPVPKDIADKRQAWGAVGAQNASFDKLCLK